MKIMYATPSFPYPPDRGDRIRSFHLIKELSRAHDVNLVSFLKSGDEGSIDFLKKYCKRVETVPFEAGHARLKSVLNVMSRTPQQIFAAASTGMTEAIESVIAEEDVDIIHIHSLQFAPYALPYKKPKVIDLVETMSLMYERMLPHRHDLMSLIYRLENAKVRSYECAALRDFDRVLVMSEPIKEYLLDLGCNANVSVVRVGIDTDYFKPEKTRREPNRIVFVGTMTFYQNVDGIVFFCREVLPLVRREIPDVKLWVIGADPPPEVTALEDQAGVEVTGYVDDIRPYLHSARAFVAPIRIATGLHAKILEAMATGIPVVATPRSCEGMPLADGEEIMLAATPVSFAEKVIKLLKDEHLSEKIAEKGRVLIDNNYTSAHSAADLERVYAEIANRTEGLS